jgi:Ca-activated chloride channel family protein
MPPGSLPGLDEEVWVIARGNVDAQSTHAAPEGDTYPTSGTLLGCFSDELEDDEWPALDDDRIIALPLEHTDVDASISAYIASVQVTQEFHNPYDRLIEAVYVFPLPDNAAVDGFIMVIGERRIRGIIREREEAERIYDDAKRAGHTASLLTQARPNIFTQKVANIEPGRQVDVEITYFHTLAYDDGWFEWEFPMVVGPRYNPNATDGIGAVPRHEARHSPHDANVEYLAPDERSGHRIDLSVALNIGVPIEDINCANHDVTVDRRSSGYQRITLRSHDRIPNKDFVLRYRVAGENVKTTLLTQPDRDGHGGYFTLMLVPPANLQRLHRAPVELVFVVDTSGSMGGQPLTIAKQAMTQALRQMDDRDTFQIIRFSNESERFGRTPLPATSRNIREGLRFVERLAAGGGTELNAAIDEAITYRRDPDRVRFVCFMTDGYISNEMEIFQRIHDDLAGSRIFSFGVGSSPNRFLMNRMAKIGSGVSAYFGPGDDPRGVIDAFFERISHPALTDICIDYSNLHATDVYPRTVPDLFVGRPVIVTGRYEGDRPAEVIVRGRVAGRTVEGLFEVDPNQREGEHHGIEAVWARTHIAELMDRSLWDRRLDVEGEVTRIALNHHLMSAWTAFVAVDGSQRTHLRSGTTVQQAVPVPEGVRYDTTVEPVDVEQWESSPPARW